MVDKERTSKTIQVTLFTPEDKQKFTEIAKDDGLSANSLVRNLVYKRLKGE